MVPVLSPSLLIFHLHCTHTAKNLDSLFFIFFTIPIIPIYKIHLIYNEKTKKAKRKTIHTYIHDHEIQQPETFPLNSFYYSFIKKKQFLLLTASPFLFHFPLLFLFFLLSLSPTLKFLPLSLCLFPNLSGKAL